MMLLLFQTAAPQPAPGLLQNPLVVMIPIFAIFYFMVLGPMRKKQRETQQMLANLKKGDEVVTSGGILGRIVALDEDRGFVVLQVADNVKLKFARGAITGLTTQPEKPASSSS